MTQRREVMALLRVDTVLTDAQLARRGLDARGFPAYTTTQRPMMDSSVEHEVTFRMIDPALPIRQPQTLPHLAGLAEIRHRLSAPAPQWQAMGGSQVAQPDAVFRSDDALVAVEYDAGYRGRVVERKMQAFERFGAVIWATPSVLRSERIRSRYPAARVLTVDYWTPPTPSNPAPSGPQT